ncbi:MAG TPA: dihydropteroate synthase [Terriglobales bacterium]|nr:dihydropteroate synthase [Terriglobales bacterium]
MRPGFDWNIGARSLALGERTLVMGVVNVTPDSFSDGGLYLEPAAAVAHGLRLLDEGADILDIGGESTRPGAAVAPASEKELRAAQRRTPVTAEEELRRVLPVIKETKHARPECIISIDTYKAEVARAAVAAGAQIVNDVSAFRWDPAMAGTVAEMGCGCVLMHMRGRPEEWRSLPPPEDVVSLVKQDLQHWSEAALQAGVSWERIALDPGFGFGKNFEQNYPLLARLEELHQLGFPLVVGTSRKSFIGRALRRDGRDAPVDERGFGTLASETVAMLKGAHIIRTHDVKACVDAARIADAIMKQGTGSSREK